MSAESSIILALNQSANTKECGSCHFFSRNDQRSEWDQSGSCKFRFPPNRVFTKQVWDAETAPLDTVNDTDGCDFYRSTGKTYIVSQRIKP